MEDIKQDAPATTEHPSVTVVSPAAIQKKSEGIVFNKESKKFEKPAAKKADTASTDATVEKPATEAKKPAVETAEEKRYKEIQRAYTKSQQENAARKKEVEELKAEQQRMNELLSKATRKPIDKVPKNPEEFQKVLDDREAEVNKNWEAKTAKEKAVARKDFTELQTRRMLADKENYPEVERLHEKMILLATQQDKRVASTLQEWDSLSPKEILEKLYAAALEDDKKAPAAKPAAPAEPTYTKEDLEKAKKEAADEAFKKAQQSDRDQQNGGSVNGMGGGKKGTSTEPNFDAMTRAEMKSWLIKHPNYKMK